MEFSNSKITSEKSLIVRALFMLEFDVTFRVGMGMEAVVSRGLFIGESILSEFEFVVLAKGVGGDNAPDERGDKSKSGVDTSNLRKLFEDELQS